MDQRGPEWRLGTRREDVVHISNKVKARASPQSAVRSPQSAVLYPLTCKYTKVL